MEIGGTLSCIRPLQGRVNGNDVATFPLTSLQQLNRRQGQLTNNAARNLRHLKFAPWNPPSTLHAAKYGHEIQAKVGHKIATKTTKELSFKSLGAT